MITPPMTTTSIETRDPAQLRPHPLVKPMPRWSPDSPEWAGFKRDVQEHGIRHPLLITADDLIVDGETRRLAAKALGLPTVPCQVIGDDEIATIILRELALRRNLTKSQLAYLAEPLLQDAFCEAESRRLANLKRGAKPPDAHSVRSGESLSDLATQIGVSHRVLQQSHELHEFFRDPTKRPITDRSGHTSEDVTLREFFEPRILMVEDPEDATGSRPYSLGAALAGIKQILDQERKEAGGQKHGGGKPAKTEEQVRLFARVFRDFSTRAKYWGGWNDETRLEALESVRPVLEKLPEDLLGRITRLIRKETARRQKIATRETHERI